MMPAIPWARLAEPDPDRVYVVLASRLPLRGYRHIFSFLRATRAVRRQLAATEGVVGYTLDAKPLSKTFWTVSAWESEEMLQRFSEVDPHRSTVAEIRPRMLKSTFVSWTVPGSELPPTWADARRRVAASENGS
jgi:hypothetical protein